MLRLMSVKPRIAIVGAGKLGSALAVALRSAGYTIDAVIARSRGTSLARAGRLAKLVGARAFVGLRPDVRADLVWFCLPDGEIAGAARALAEIQNPGPLPPKDGGRRTGHPQFEWRGRVALHSSGVLTSDELSVLRELGAAVASVHPLMTFVAGTHPSVTGVPFAIEGDRAAMQVARQIVRKLGGESFSLPAARKAAYHAWATLTSPLLLAFLVTLEEAARAAGFTRKDARRKSLPIIRQTLANYSRLGPAPSFSGPLVRGDAETVARHLSVLKKQPGPREVYVALARAALRGLPVKNQDALSGLLD